MIRGLTNALRDKLYPIPSLKEGKQRPFNRNYLLFFLEDILESGFGGEDLDDDHDRRHLISALDEIKQSHYKLPDEYNQYYQGWCLEEKEHGEIGQLKATKKLSELFFYDLLIGH